ncbi:unnamed protein product [Nippostrongylus brasiliensis]|uniref:EGF-like domain-containing protein n=1 Tax=Nippostrongylus brasiliensis TaxID=27835 RepID=A0A0N4XH62_NIPBR|nr:unnamed protein product [Nippostrongylus brasiliensis]
MQSSLYLSDAYEDSSCLLNQGACHRLCMDYRSNEITCFCNVGYLLNEVDRHSCQGWQLVTAHNHLIVLECN